MSAQRRLSNTEDREVGLDITAQYLREAAETPLLTPWEEIDLARAIEQGRQAAIQLQRHGRAPVKVSQWQRARAAGHRARGQLLKANLRLVISVAKHYRSPAVPFLDLIQEGNLGLLSAIEKFDYTRGYRFSTYATWWIRQGITRAVANQGRAIRLPVYVNDQIRRFQRVCQALEQRTGRGPTPAELAEKLGLPLKKVAWLSRVARLPVSLDEPMGAAEDSCRWGDLLEDESAPPAAERAAEVLLQAELEEELAGLRPREAHILRLRYGLETGAALTLEEVGQQLGLTRERIRQIEASALQKLRRCQSLRNYV